MSCRNFDQATYEHDLERYLQAALELSDFTPVHVRHVPSDECDWVTGQDGGRVYITDIEATISGIPMFLSVRLRNWPLERRIEEDLGPRFVQALRLLLDACLEAQEYHFRLWREEHYPGLEEQTKRPDEESTERNEAAGHVQPGPQPRRDNPFVQGAINEDFIT